VLQKEWMDDGLKNALWNAAYRRFWMYYADHPGQPAASIFEGRLLIALWTEHFNRALDELNPFFHPALGAIKKGFVASDWASVYDFVEFIANYDIVNRSSGPFIADCNTVLEKHLSAYRFVGTTLAPITSDEEIAAIEQAVTQGGRFGPVAVHVQTALTRLADRAAPDFRNSIKESISAVEAACQIITGDPTATVGKALKQIGVHPALEKGFSAIYGYTSDAQGIRHALLEEPNVDVDDAKFFLVSCAAFANYLITKSASGSTSTP